ncbi:hypothetical protein SCA6_010544 [Theobroma cacao]
MKHISPTFDEYLENGEYSCGAVLAMTQILIGIEEADKSACEWMINNDNKFPKLSKYLADEEKRGFASSSACYMKQYNVSRQEAIKTFREKLAVTWKDINEGCMRTTPVPQQILRRALNYARLLDFAYRDDDQYTKPELFKDGITKVLIHPIPL